MSHSSSEDSESNEGNYEPQTELLEQRILYLEEEVKQNPADFKKSLELINMLRFKGDLTKVREIREKLSENYPLPESVWLAWIKDEERLVSPVNNKHDLDQVSNLYERATGDYNSVTLWLNYVEWYSQPIEKESPKEKQSLVRELYEKAISNVGFDVKQGSLLWASYIKFEKEVYSNIKEPDQLLRINSLYQRMMCVPLDDLLQFHEEYNKWKRDNNLPSEAKGKYSNETIEACFARAKSELKELLPFENCISDARDFNRPDYSQLKAPKGWFNYLDLMKKKLEQKFSSARNTTLELHCLLRVQYLFERALKNYFLRPKLWEDYIGFMKEHYEKFYKTFSDKLSLQDLEEPLIVTKVQQPKEFVLSLCRRSLRNCPYSVELWVLYLTELERVSQPFEEIHGIFESALASGCLSKASDLYQLFSCIIQISIRDLNHHINSEIQTNNSTSSDIVATKLQTVQWLCHRGVETLSESTDDYQELRDLRMLYALVLATLCNDLPSANQQQDLIISPKSKDQSTAAQGSEGNVTEANADEIPPVSLLQLLEIVHFNMAFQNFSFVREIFQKAIKLPYSREERKTLHKEWVLFESLCGHSLNLWEFANQQKSQFALSNTQTSEDIRSRKRKFNRDTENDEEDGKRFKRPRYESHAKSEKDKREENEESSSSESKERVNGEKDQENTESMEVEEVERVEGHKKSRDKREHRRGQRDREFRPKGRQETRTGEKKTLHVANVPSPANAVTLKQIFSQFGDISDVRLVEGKNFAYIDYLNPNDAKKALNHKSPIFYLDTSATSSSTDRKELQVSLAHRVRPGLKLISSLTNPPPPAAPPVKKFDDQLTLFIINLAFCTTDEQLKDFLLKESGGLTAHGNTIKIKETRIVKNRDTGKSKGIAYVQFEDLESLEKVLSTCNGKSLDNFALKIEISKPPTKSTKVEAPKFLSQATTRPSTVKVNESKWAKYAPNLNAKLDLKEQSQNNTNEEAISSKEKSKKGILVPRAIKKKQ